jgi:uncharacterized caspase-like protein
MNRARHSTSLFAAVTAFIMAAAAATAGAAITVHKWEDHKKPFTTRLKAVSLENPGVVLLTLPAPAIENKQVELTVFSSSFGGYGSYVYPFLLQVNDSKPQPLKVGPGLKVLLERQILKPGINTLRFFGSTGNTMIDVYELKIELAEAPPAKAPAAPLASSKSEDGIKPREPDRTKPSERPLEVTPTPKAEDVRPPAKTPLPSRKETPAPAAVKAEEPKPEAAAVQPSAAPHPIPAQPAVGDPGQRWAVIIGVSDYEDSRIPSLRYAARDAQVFHDWLVSPAGGRYAPSKAKLLLNRNATNEKIKDALFNWLKQAIEEDVVVIYFAGHGSPESPDAAQNLYLLPYNARYDNIAVTGFPMWDIETALKRFIKAKRVVIVADACHAAGVGQAFDVAVRADRGLQVNQINSGLQNLTEIGEGVCVISASRDKEFSQEGREWGGGHGVFSYYLIEGLKGAADFDKSGTVSVGEITVYVSQQVRRATRNAQNPIVAGRFDPSLVIGK